MNTKIIVFCLIALASCSHEETKKPDFIFENKIETEKKELPKAEEVILKKEITNLDFEFQDSLKNVWSTYFKENYNDSRSLDIFVATNRIQKSTSFGCTNQYFGINESAENNLKFGLCRINVPKNHSTGIIEFSDSPRVSSHNFFKVGNAKSIVEKNIIEFTKRTKRTPLIFVHGFNVKYQDAILRAAQISYDLKYQGPVILFTWPSGSGDGFFDDKLLNKTYEYNKKSAAASIELFKNFIQLFSENNIPVNIMVHSMGHQVVLPALNLLGLTPQTNTEHKTIHELILNAPDFEVDKFKDSIESLKNISDRITLYCSFNDKAMVASSSINKTERLGACAHLEGIDTINVSLIDDKTFGTGHSYYASRAIITDVFQVLLGLDVEKRLFMKKSEPNSTENFYLRN